MPNPEIISLFQHHGVRSTANRILVAELLMHSARPLSMVEIETLLPSMDKSSIFRALNVFREGRMVHIIEDGCGGARYELCQSCHEGGHDEDLHAHFFCECCQKTFCLEGVHIPQVDLPQGYEAHSANFVIKGLCPDCRRG